MTRLKLLLPLTAAILLAACAGNSGRYTMKDDRPPADAPDVSKVEDAHPRFEPYSKQGNKDYQVRGKSYQVMPSGKGYKVEGLASWYGAKFHGHLTSNGETYDMYSMSAAHKTLPLPSYVRVTNLANNKSVVVRVNDRGPFHPDRVIDLSYAAAYRLDMLKTGTARVRLEVLFEDSEESQTMAELRSDNLHYVQVMASGSRERLLELASELENKYQVKSRITDAKPVYRLQLGPVSHEGIAAKLLEKLKQEGFPSSYMVTEPKS
ncbi:septal ring lytic transglycosylase RlpA family protein [Shewanella algae]|uniref:septal ring lytic transglycosylase RlpA family protein n=1 Tax=Shewanella algae TaxID=38313 RepID=UPI001AADAA82|nr:septal ring lytic transglycosylase RlpA family protein [Shewanella algae]MBO2650800.1 septal ring lytic transglycosylase RlpA family protein [Shewanella algae]